MPIVDHDHDANDLVKVHDVPMESVNVDVCLLFVLVIVNVNVRMNDEEENDRKHDYEHKNEHETMVVDHHASINDHDYMEIRNVIVIVNVHEVVEREV